MEIENGYTPLLLHCEKGTRPVSPTMAALYLYYKGRFDDFDAALEFVRAKHRKIKPKKIFVKFIKEAGASEAGFRRPYESQFQRWPWRSESIVSALGIFGIFFFAMYFVAPLLL